MRRSFLAVAAGAALAFGLAACGGGSKKAATQTTKPGAQPEAAPMGAPAGSLTGQQVRLVPKNNSDVNGSVSLTPQGDSLVVAVSVTGLPDGAGAYPSHIHEGSCAAPGHVVQPLNDVQGDSVGNGHATTTVAMSVLKQGQKHLIMVHRKNGKAVSCADLPATIAGSGM